MKQKILINMQLIILALIAMVSCGSSKNDPDKPVEPSTTSMKILVDSTTVKPVKGLVTIVLNFQGYDEISYMNVTKVMNGYKSTSKYYKRTISSPYTFQYSVLGSDAASFDFEFSLFNEANQSSDTVTVKIDNSAGVHNTVLVISDLKVVSRVTGAENNGHDGLPAVSYTINNRTDQLYNVGGCDLGIVWEIKPGRYGMFFGDTFGKDFKPNFSSPGPNGGSWRSNVLFFSDDTDLSDGLTISGAATDATGTNAREICFGAKNTSGSGDWTSIPTAAVHANGAEYVHYMNIRTWTGWISNYSSLYKSTTQGQTWERCYNVSFASRSNFGQVGYFAKDGYVYMIGLSPGVQTSHILPDSRKRISRISLNTSSGTEVAGWPERKMPRLHCSMMWLENCHLPIFLSSASGSCCISASRGMRSR
jgi:hypothetical protein